MTVLGNSSAPTTPDEPTMRAALLRGCRAPSVHNSQPWRWFFDGARLHLFSDPERQLPVADPEGRQLVISCGAVLDHVRTIFAALGWHTDVVRLPDPDHPDLLATIEFRLWEDPATGSTVHAAAIERRYTDRLPMLIPERWDAMTPVVLREMAATHDVDLDMLPDSARARLATASEQSAALHRYDMEYQTELRWWTGHDRPADGIPPAALPTETELARVGVARSFPPVRHPAHRAEAIDQSYLILLSTAEESPLQWLRTGEALSAILLECTVAGWATCPLTHITETSAGRALLQGFTTNRGNPQVLLRVGTAPENDRPPATPRHPLTEVFTEHP
ncbi:Acg family FMN-binding oxidoreductase [Nocardia sp. NPDC058176]|uniref:Acg family FMN-binding oxidoreductase n=1 Tax=Nocardia sp. NPDC058176 TaxID=3346368 RepID=UPI0036D8BAB5